MWQENKTKCLITYILGRWLRHHLPNDFYVYPDQIHQ